MNNHKTLIFKLSSKELLNSNNLPANTFVKSSKASKLRELSSKIGLQLHPDKQNAEKRIELIHEESKKALMKSRTKKRMHKKGEPEEEIEKELQKIDNNFLNVEKKGNIQVEYLFHRFKVTVIICPPTRRRVDPPNFYPSIKAIIDGLTDASWWEDDKYSQLVEMDFLYGGLSKTKNKFEIIIDIKETGEEKYIISPEEECIYRKYIDNKE